MHTCTLLSFHGYNHEHQNINHRKLIYENNVANTDIVYKKYFCVVIIIILDHVKKSMF